MTVLHMPPRLTPACPGTPGAVTSTTVTAVPVPEHGTVVLDIGDGLVDIVRAVMREVLDPAFSTFDVAAVTSWVRASGAGSLTLTSGEAAVLADRVAAASVEAEE